MAKKWETVSGSMLLWSVVRQRRAPPFVGAAK